MDPGLGGTRPESELKGLGVRPDARCILGARVADRADERVEHGSERIAETREVPPPPDRVVAKHGGRREVVQCVEELHVDTLV